MKKIYFLYLFLCIAIGWNGCVSDPELDGGLRNARKPSVQTTEILRSTANSVTVSGEVTQENGAPVTEAGFCWGLDAAITLHENNKKAVAKRKTSFEATIEELGNNKTYHIRAYAINAVDTAYGEVLSFQTKDGLGSVRTTLPEQIKSTAAQCGGVISAQGEAEVTTRGVYLMSGPAPSDSDSLIISVVEADSFYCQITNLKPQTTYYVRAYAANKYGAYNGAKVEKFTTTDGLPVLNNAKFRLVKVDYTSAEFSYAITSEGDSAVIASGLCFSTKPNPTIEEGDTVICGRGIGEFTGTIQDMKQQQAYYVRAFAINKAGVRYTEGEGLHTIPVSELPTVETAEVTDIQSGSASVGGEVLAEGASPVTESGVYWGKLPDPTLEDSEGSLAISSGTQAFRGTLNQLRGDRSYYLRAYATNANGTSYGKTVSFKTPAIFGSLIAFEGGYRIPGSVAYCTLSGSVGFLLGGDMGREYTDELWVFNVSEQNWLDRKSQPEKLSGQSVFSIGLGVWAFGGWDNERKISDSLYVYSISGNYWDSEDSDRETRPKGRYRAVTCRVDDHAYLIGGRRENNPLKEVWSYTPSTTSWEKKGDFPVEQYGGIVVAVNGRVYAGLGIISKDDVSPKYTNKFWSADEGLDSWSEESDFPGEQCQGAVAWGNDVYAVDNEGTIWRYDTDTHAWSERSRLDTDRRTVHCIYALNDLIYIGLGSGSGALITYDPSWDN